MSEENEMLLVGTGLTVAWLMFMMGSQWLTGAAERVGGRTFGRVVEGATWAVVIAITMVGARLLQ